MQFFTLISNLMSVLPETFQNDMFLSKYILTFFIFYILLCFHTFYRYLPLFTVIIPVLQATIETRRDDGDRDDGDRDDGDDWQN